MLIILKSSRLSLEGKKMKEHQFDDFKTVINYNSELWFRFIGACEQGINSCDLSEAAITELTQSLDLVRAVNSYRAYPSPDKLFAAYPDLISQKEYVLLLWRHFNSLSAVELSDLVIDMIHEISNCSVFMS